MSQVEKKDKKVSRVAPEYNDIFRRMFEVLSDSIDRHHPDVPKSRVPKSNDPIVYETSSRELNIEFCFGPIIVHYDYSGLFQQILLVWQSS